MFKKLSLTILLSVSLCAAEPLNGLTPYTPRPTSYAAGWDVVITMLVLVTIPRLLKERSKIDEKKKDYKVKIAECLLIGAGTAWCLYELSKLCAVAKNIYDYNFPSEAEKVIRKASAAAGEMLKSKRELRSCFMSNATTSRNEAGLPTACENFSNTYRTLAGQPALDEMVTNFKDTHAYQGS